MSEVAMKFVSDAAQLLADYDKMKAKEEGLQKAVTDTGKAVAARRKEQAAMAREAAKIESQTATPLEKYKKRLAEIEKLHQAGKISEETHRRAAVLAWKQSGLASMQAEKALKKEEAERAKVIEAERLQSESARRRARYEEALGRKQKQVLREIETPQQRYNQKIKDLNRLRRDGKISEEQYATAVRKVTGDLKNQTEASGKATAVDGVVAMAARWVSVGAAIAAATTAVRDYQTAKEEAAQRAIESRRGMGSLAQVAEDEQHFLKLQQKARELYLAGAVSSEDEGARVVFSLQSAGAMKQFGLFKEAGSSKLIEDLAPAAKAAATLQTSMGEAETGDSRAILSKAFGASLYSPATAEKLLEAAAKSGGSAHALGYTDEEVLASTAIMATSTGEASEGGTSVAALMRSIDEKRGEIAGKGGKAPASLREAVLAIRAKNLDSEQLKKLLGRSEAVRAYRGLLQNMPMYERALAAVQKSQETDEIGRRLKFHELDPTLMGAKRREQAEAALKESMRPAGDEQNYAEAFLQQEKAFERESGKDEIGIWVGDKLRRFHRWTRPPGGEGQDIKFLREQAEDPFAPNPRAKAFLDELERTRNAEPQKATYQEQFRPLSLPQDRSKSDRNDAAEKLNAAADKLDRAVEKQVQKIDELIAAGRETNYGMRDAAGVMRESAQQRTRPLDPATSHADHR